MSYSVRHGLLTLDCDLAELERLSREAAAACEDTAVEAFRAALQPVATSATARWYTQVDRETGRTGKIAVEVRATRKYTTIVAIGSTNLATAESGAPVARVVHRPGADSEARKVISRGEAVPPGWRIVRNYGAGFLIQGPNPKRSDGGSVLKDLVVTPANAAVAQAVDRLEPATQAALRGAGG